MNMKLLTLVVPVYNTEKYIKRCLDSVVLKEIIDDIEILIISDGSKDKSIQIAKEYEKLYPNSITVIEKENGGHGSTINKGLEEANGKYFRVLDSDDWFNSRNFIEFVEKLKNENSDLIVTDYSQEHIYNNESIYIKYTSLENGKTYYFDTMDLRLLNGGYFVMATSTYKTCLLRESGLSLFEKTYYVDMQYNVVAFSKVKSITYYNLDIYRYFIGRKEQSNNFNSLVKNQDNHEKVMRFLVDYYTNNFSLFSDNKKEYYKLIIYYMLYTHYSIYCIYDMDHKNAYNKILNFDNYLKTENPDLYAKSDIEIIKANRKTHFVFTKINGKRFNKCINFLKKFRR